MAPPGRNSRTFRNYKKITEHQTVKKERHTNLVVPFRPPTRIRRTLETSDVLGQKPIPRHSMYSIYAPIDPPGTTPTDRSICQSHGVSGICVESQPVRSFRRAVAMWSRFCRASSVFPLSQRTMAVRAWGSGRSAVCAVRVYSALVLGGGRQKRNRVQMGNTLWLIQLHCCISI